VLSRLFFCQAEYGIRDPLVTGVQTCALPIWGREPSFGLPLAPSAGNPLSPRLCLRFPSQADLQNGRVSVLAGKLTVASTVITNRSEERRVGKIYRVWSKTYQESNVRQQHRNR